MIVFRFKDRPVRWAKAKEYCQDLGAKLVEIDSPQENEAIVDEIKKHSWSKEKKQFWMGLTDRRHEGFFVVESTGEHIHICETKRIGILNWSVSQKEVKTESKFPKRIVPGSQSYGNISIY